MIHHSLSDGGLGLLAGDGYGILATGDGRRQYAMTASARGASRFRDGDLPSKISLRRSNSGCRRPK